jgi:hypothetical protein
MDYHITKLRQPSPFTGKRKKRHGFHGLTEIFPIISCSSKSAPIRKIRGVFVFICPDSE